MNWLKNDFIKLSTVAKALWGVNNRSTTSKLSQKMKGKQNSFNQEELKKLEEIRKELIKNIS